MVPHIAVLITCHNRKEKTISCLRNLFKQTGINLDFDIEVFLTDDGSTDGTTDAVKTLFPAVNIIHGNGLLYWNKGMHLSWSVARQKKTYDFYLWLNDDTQLVTGAIIELLDCETQFKNTSLICGAMCSQYNKQYTYGGLDRNGKAVIPDGKMQRCFEINGNCVLISKAIVDKIGILDPIYPHAIGDFDYGMRAVGAGVDVLTTRIFIGYCEKNKTLPKWCYSSTPITERFKSLYSPLGSSHPYYFFIYDRRHFGVHIAVKHFISIHLRALIPSLWKHLKQKNAASAS